MHFGAWEFVVKEPADPVKDESKTTAAATSDEVPKVVVSAEQEIIPELTWREKCERQLRRDRAYTLIYQNISDEYKPMISSTTDGAEAWIILKHHFEPTTRARIIQLLDEFFGVRCQPGEDVGLFLCRVKVAAGKLREVGHEPPPLYVGFQMIRSLPPEFQSTVQAIYRWPDDRFLPDKIETEVILEANRLTLATHDSVTSKEAVFFNQSVSKNRAGKNSKFVNNKAVDNVKFCSDKNVSEFKFNNFKDGNFKRNAKFDKNKPKVIGPCYRCKAYGHLIADCKGKISRHARNPEGNCVEVKKETEFKFVEFECSLTEFYPMPHEANESVIRDDNDCWVFDTAATAHFCNNRDLFLDLKPVTNIRMALAVGEKESPVEGSGTIHFFVNGRKGKINEIRLTNVLYNPNLRRNLLSGARLEKMGANFVGNKGKVLIYDKDWNKLIVAVRKNGLYFVKPVKYLTKTEVLVESAHQVSEKPNLCELWHFRFCHINNDYIVRTGKNKSVQGLPVLKDEFSDCIPCKLAKSRRVSFKPIGQIRSKRPLELLHLDVCGPLPVLSQGGNRYFLTIIDDFSRKVHAFPIRHKSDVFETYLRFHHRAERFLNRKVVTIRTDGGLEFCNRDFDTFLEKLGIKHEITNTYSPEMNGVAERFNLTALDGVKTLLGSSGVSKRFWGEALMCFCYTWNRVCHKGQKKTPFELYAGKKPSVSHLKRFGCLAYVGVPKQLRKKLDMRAKLGIMFGYAQKTKGYRIWLIEDAKLIETINVRFDESQNGMEVARGRKILNYVDFNFPIPDYPEEENDLDIVRDSLEKRLEVQQPEDQEREDNGEDNILEPQNKIHSESDPDVQPSSSNKLIPCSEIAWIRQPKLRKNQSRVDIYYGIKGTHTRLRSYANVIDYCKQNNIEYDESLFNFSTKDSSSGEVSELVKRGGEANLVEVKIPRSYKEALKSPETAEWERAMSQEIGVMHDREVWELVDPPENVKILGSRWVYALKMNDKGEIMRYKARLVAQGFDQIKGESYDEVFSPVVNFCIIRLFFTIFVCLLKWHHVQLDINNAYLYAGLDSEIYMYQPDGFIEESPSKVCKLKKAIYGLHQSSREWFKEINDKLLEKNFIKLDWCNCAYTLNDNLVLLLYVDDIILFGKSKQDIEKGVELLQKHFDLKVLGKTKKLLGIEFEEKEGKLFIHQKSYINKICEKYNKFKYPLRSLPISKGQVLSKLDCPSTQCEFKEMTKIPYRSLIGSLAFIASKTRPDICYATNILSQFQANPGMKHWEALLKLLGYLKSTINYKLELSRIKNLNLKCFSDSDFAANRDDRVSMGGYILFLDKSPISWKTFKHKCVSLSTMEAEFVSLTEAAKELIWVKNVLQNKTLNLGLSTCVMLCDNTAAISFSNSAFENSRTKHIHIKYHFIRNLVNEKMFKLEYVRSLFNLADVFTKPFVKDQLEKFCGEIFETL